MPMLSLHNYSMPSGSASYTLGLSGAPNVSSYSYQTSGGVSGLLGAGVGTSSGISNIIGTGGLSGLGGLSNALVTNLGYNPNTSYSTYTNPLIGCGTLKMKAYDDLDMLGRYGNRAGTPSSPIPPASWGLDSFTGLDGVNPTFMHTQRSMSRLGGLDLDSKFKNISLWPNGHLTLIIQI